MCLRVENEATVKIAQEDIVCYKVMRKSILGLLSPYKQERYNLKELKKAVIGKLELFPIFSFYGHDPLQFKAIEEGLHSFMELEEAVAFMGGGDFYVICSATIPKGSEYYEGRFDIVRTLKNNSYKSYVSNQLILQVIL